MKYPVPGVVHYPSLSAYQQALAQPKDPNSGSPSTQDSRWNGIEPEKWDLGVGWDGAVELARTGWSDGAARVRTLAEKLRDSLEPPEYLAPAYDVAPFGPSVALDMGRYLEGDPEHWRIEAPRRGGKVIVAVSVGAPGQTDARVHSRRSAVGLAIAWILADEGYEVELRGVRANRVDSKPLSGCSYVVPLEPYLAAFWIGHPAAHRRFWFRWVENFDPYKSKNGCGTPTLEEKDCLPPGTVYIPTVTGETEHLWSTDESAEAEARRILSSLTLGAT